MPGGGVLVNLSVGAEHFKHCPAQQATEERELQPAEKSHATNSFPSAAISIPRIQSDTAAMLGP